MFALFSMMVSVIVRSGQTSGEQKHNSAPTGKIIIIIKLAHPVVELYTFRSTISLAKKGNRCLVAFGIHI